MANLIPGNLPNPTQARSQVNASRPPNPNDNRNTVMGDLFKGLGNLVDTGVNAAYDVIKHNIREDVYSNVDRERGTQGVDDVSLYPDAESLKGKAVPGSEGAPNTAAEDYRGRVQKLVQARKAGAISDTSYYQQLEATTRSIRSKYPGFRQEVDAIIRSETGVNPANALRKSILNDLAKAERANADSGKALMSKAETAIAAGKVSPAEAAEYFSNRGAGAAQKILLSAGKGEYERKQVNGEIAQYNLFNHKQKYTQTQIMGRLQDLKGQIDKTFFQKMQGAIPMESLRAMVASGNMDEKTTTIANAAIADMIQQYKTIFNNNLDNVKTADGTIRRQLTPDQQKQMEEYFLKDLTEMQRLITNKEYGVLATKIMQRNIRYSDEVKKLEESSPTMRILNGLGTVNQEAMKLLMGTNAGGIRSTAAGDIGKYIAAGAATKQPEGQSLTFPKVQRDLSKMSSEERKRISPAIFANMVTILKSPSASVEMKEEMIKNMLAGANGDALFASYSKGSQAIKVFQRLTSPDIVNGIKGTSNAQDYYDTVTRSFNKIFNQNIRDIGSMSGDSYIAVKWNPKTTQFEVGYTKKYTDQINAAREMNRNAPVNIPGGADAGIEIVHAERSKNVRNSVSQINAAIGNLNTVFKSRGLDLQSEIGKLFNGVDVNQNKILQMMKRSYNSANKVDESKGNSSDLPDPQVEGTLGGTPLDFSSAPSPNRGTAGEGFSLEAPTQKVASRSFDPKEISRIITYDNKGIRNKPLEPQLESVLAKTASTHGITISVSSGGQTSNRNPKLYKKKGGWTGSHRHDHGGAGDIKLVNSEGRILSFLNPEDKKVMFNFVRDVVASGANGVGAGLGYMGEHTIHIGGGSRASWGGARWVRKAWQEGMRLRNKR